MAYLIFCRTLLREQSLMSYKAKRLNWVVEMQWHESRRLCRALPQNLFVLPLKVEVSPQPAAIMLAEISLLHEELRASLAADFRSSVETLATKLDNIQSTVFDLAQRVDSNATEVDHHFVQLESV